jgi:hypothetical protein
VAEGVVDLLEAVQVDHEHRRLALATAGAAQGLPQPVPEQGPVGQAGE